MSAHWSRVVEHKKKGVCITRPWIAGGKKLEIDSQVYHRKHTYGAYSRYPIQHTTGFEDVDERTDKWVKEHQTIAKKGAVCRMYDENQVVQGEIMDTTQVNTSNPYSLPTHTQYPMSHANSYVIPPPNYKDAQRIVRSPRTQNIPLFYSTLENVRTITPTGCGRLSTYCTIGNMGEPTYMNAHGGFSPLSVVGTNKAITDRERPTAFQKYVPKQDVGVSQQPYSTYGVETNGCNHNTDESGVEDHHPQQIINENALSKEENEMTEGYVTDRSTGYMDVLVKGYMNMAEKSIHDEKDNHAAQEGGTNATCPETSHDDNKGTHPPEKDNSEASPSENVDHADETINTLEVVGPSPVVRGSGQTKAVVAIKKMLKAQQEKNRERHLALAINRLSRRSEKITDKQIIDTVMSAEKEQHSDVVSSGYHVKAAGGIPRVIEEADKKYEEKQKKKTEMQFAQQEWRTVLEDPKITEKKKKEALGMRRIESFTTIQGLGNFKVNKVQSGNDVDVNCFHNSVYDEQQKANDENKNNDTNQGKPSQAVVPTLNVREKRSCQEGITNVKEKEGFDITDGNDGRYPTQYAIEATNPGGSTDSSNGSTRPYEQTLGQSEVSKKKRMHVTAAQSKTIEFMDLMVATNTKWKHMIYYNDFKCQPDNISRVYKITMTTKWSSDVKANKLMQSCFAIQNYERNMFLSTDSFIPQNISRIIMCKRREYFSTTNCVTIPYNDDSLRRCIMRNGSVLTQALVDLLHHIKPVSESVQRIADVCTPEYLDMASNLRALSNDIRRWKTMIAMYQHQFQVIRSMVESTGSGVCRICEINLGITSIDDKLCPGLTLLTGSVPINWGIVRAELRTGRQIGLVDNFDSKK